MRVHFIYSLAVGYSDHFEKTYGARLYFFLGPSLTVVKRNYFIHLITYTEDRVQSGHGFLEYHGDVVSPDVLHHFIGCFGQIISFISEIQPYFACGNLPLRALEKLHDRKTCNALSASGFSDDTDSFSNRDLKGDAVDSVDCSDVREEICMKIIYFKRIAGVVHDRKIFALGNIFAFSLFLVYICYLAVFPCYTAGFPG